MENLTYIIKNLVLHDAFCDEILATVGLGKKDLSQSAYLHGVTLSALIHQWSAKNGKPFVVLNSFYRCRITIRAIDSKRFIIEQIYPLGAENQQVNPHCCVYPKTCDITEVLRSIYSALDNSF